jgi:hypothetical protein
MMLNHYRRHVPKGRLLQIGHWNLQVAKLLGGSFRIGGTVRIAHRPPIGAPSATTTALRGLQPPTAAELTAVWPVSISSSADRQVQLSPVKSVCRKSPSPPEGTQIGIISPGILRKKASCGNAQI